MEFVRQIARIVTVLHEGTVICEGPVEKVQADQSERDLSGRQRWHMLNRMVKRRSQRSSRLGKVLNVPGGHASGLLSPAALWKLEMVNILEE